MQQQVSVISFISSRKTVSWIVSLQEKSLLAMVKCPRKNSNIVAKDYLRGHMALEGRRICFCC